MKRLMFEVDYGQEREFCEIRRGLLDGCELFLSREDRFPMRAGIFEREISDHFSDLAGRANVFVDIGAAEGWFSIYMLRNTEAKVFAFEAAKDFNEILQRNLKRNASGDHELVVSDSALIGLRNHDTVDSIVGTREGPILLKIDVDGDEVEVLEGARAVLECADTSVVLKVHNEPTESRCLRVLDQFGFNVQITGPAWWRRSIDQDRSDEPVSRWLIAEKIGFGALLA